MKAILAVVLGVVALAGCGGGASEHLDESEEVRAYAQDMEAWWAEAVRVGGRIRYEGASSFEFGRPAEQA